MNISDIVCNVFLYIVLLFIYKQKLTYIYVYSMAQCHKNYFGFAILNSLTIP